jgi:hypothetical protein
MLDVKNKQNSLEILDLLFLQRIYCEKIEKKTILVYILTFIIAVLGIIAKNCYYLILINFIFIIACNQVILNRKKEILLMSTVKETIDRKLFNLNFENIYLEFSEGDIKKYLNIEKKKNSKRYKKEICNNGTDEYRGVKDWYLCDDTLENEKEVLSYQKQNVYFTENLSKKFIESLIWIIIIILVIVLLSLKNLTLEILLVYYLYPFVTFIILVYNDFLNYRDFKKVLEKLEREFEVMDKKDIEEKDLERIQKLIFLYRQSEYRPPLELFHRFLSRKLHEFWNK